MPRTGSAKGQTDTIVNGIKMAIEEYGGEIAGMKIEYQTGTTPTHRRRLVDRGTGNEQRQPGASPTRT